MHPFSFKEFLAYYEFKDINITFYDYVVKGGIAWSSLYNKSSVSRRMGEGSILFSLGRKTIVKITYTKILI